MPMERADNALQNRGMIVPERGAAMADWQRFSIDLREQCFEHDEGGDHNRTGRTLHSHIQVGRGPLSRLDHLGCNLTGGFNPK
jgi:hypothetical protein